MAFLDKIVVASFTPFLFSFTGPHDFAEEQAYPDPIQKRHVPLWTFVSPFHSPASFDLSPASLDSLSVWLGT